MFNNTCVNFAPLKKGRFFVQFAQFSNNKTAELWKGGILTTKKKCCIMCLSDETSGSFYLTKARKGGGWQTCATEKTMTKHSKKAKYAADMPRRMYRFFTEYSEGGLPSFHKFARSVGLTVRDIERFRKHERFDAAYEECRQIRRDYLIDRALEKRFDSSLTKYLLALEDDERLKSENGDFTLKLEVAE